MRLQGRDDSASGMDSVLVRRCGNLRRSRRFLGEIKVFSGQFQKCRGCVGIICFQCKLNERRRLPAMVVRTYRRSRPPMALGSSNNDKGPLEFSAKDPLRAAVCPNSQYVAQARPEWLGER
jgi:hypothetical protein